MCHGKPLKEKLNKVVGVKNQQGGGGREGWGQIVVARPSASASLTGRRQKMNSLTAPVFCRRLPAHDAARLVRSFAASALLGPLADKELLHGLPVKGLDELADLVLEDVLVVLEVNRGLVARNLVVLTRVSGRRTGD
jgi:hypothetical protein